MFDICAFQEHVDYFSREHAHSFELLPGNGCVMVSAPHSVSQLRNGQIKYAEPQTGALAKMLHDALGCPVIYKTQNCGDDANYDAVSSYKQTLTEYIRQNNISFLIDLHQLAATRDVMIDIGTGKLKNIACFDYVNAALRAFSARNLGIVQIDTPFDASCPYTISSFVATACNISCLQIEINSRLLWENESCRQAKEVFYALAELISRIPEMRKDEL